jgi:hypothetical protein
MFTLHRLEILSALALTCTLLSSCADPEANRSRADRRVDRYDRLNTRY